MKRILLSVLCIVGIISAISAQEKYKQAWDALNWNDRKKASALLSEGMNDASGDSYMTNLYIQNYNGKQDEIKDFQTSFYTKVANPYPYVYALWFNSSMLGAYGKKHAPHQLQLIDRIIDDKKAPGTLVAAAHYQKGMHLLYSNQMDNAAKEYDMVGNIRNWQYAGPFENLSESGIYKDYGPLQHPEPEAVFTSSTNAQVKWFTPSTEIQDGWNPMCFQINKRTAVAYAQTFVTAPDDQEIYFNAGVTGAMKIWLNDELIMKEYKERTTELDTYTVKCKLKKGNNRILIQLSFTGTEYANFGIRLTDNNYNAIAGLTSTPVYKPYNKISGTPSSYAMVPHFAEAFFKDKIGADSSNLLNYLLLADVYMRNKKTLEARHLIETALVKAPDNNLMREKLIEVLIEEDNHGTMMEELEKLKKSDPESLIALELSIKDEISNEKYDNAAKELERRIELYGEDATTMAYKISLLSYEKKYNELVKAGEDAYKKYPDQDNLLPMMYAIRKEVYKDNKGALKLYENYFKGNFNVSTALKYSEILQEQGQTDKSLQIKMRILKDFPYDPSGYSRMSTYYYGIKQYDKAEDVIKKALDLSPYNESYWEQLGDIKSETKKIDEAIQAYDRSLLYDPNQYSVINKLRKLKGKQESYTLIPQANIDSIIKNDRPDEAKNTDYGYYFMYDEKNVIVHPGGATEEYYLFMVKITNEKGIDKYKESSIGYSNSQNLLIEKSEIIKKSGAKAQGERSGNDIVFTNLEVGDVVVFKYRLQDYSYGRFAKEFWDKYYFGGQIYTAKARYNLLLPSDRSVKYLFTNTTIQPVISDVENFRKYSWSVDKQETMKDEPLMPNNCDVGTILHISTVPAWQEIASWYADIVSNKTEEDYEITVLYKKLFPDAKAAGSQFKKAKVIYDYIEKNIRYSSVSFRQSAFVPQRASATLSTRLGDCKDLSNLFVTLSRMAGIDCKMVLVDTRDNGAKDIILPSIEFNHCIVKANLDKKDYYIELTQNNLPFASIPNTLIDALILEIPDKPNQAPAALASLVATNRTKDLIRRIITIKPSENDLQVQDKVIRYGHFSAETRETFGTMDYDKQVLEMEKRVASIYKNNVKIDKVSFGDLKELSDSVTYNYNYKVKNEISEIGSLQTFRITYPDVVATLNNFSSDTRIYPIEYIDYENADAYETIVKVEAPAGKKFVELPVNEVLKFGNMQFSINYQLTAPDKLTVSRKFKSERKVIPASEYAEFKVFFEKIIKAEQKMIAYK